MQNLFSEVQFVMDSIVKSIVELSSEVLDQSAAAVMVVSSAYGLI